MRGIMLALGQGQGDVAADFVNLLPRFQAVVDPLGVRSTACRSTRTDRHLRQRPKALIDHLSDADPNSTSRAGRSARR